MDGPRLLSLFLPGPIPRLATMDKLVQRTIKAERQVRRRLADSSKNAYRKDLLAHRRRTKSATEDLNVNIANARRVRHERWELGPLAPKRSIENGYGVATENARTGNGADQNVIRPFEREARCEWAGGSKYLNLAPGDRVVIMEGHDKGNIDTITAINVSTGTLQLKDFAKVRFLSLYILFYYPLQTGSERP